MAGEKGPYALHQGRELEEIRQALHDLSNQTSIVHANLTYAEDHMPAGPVDFREALQEAAVAAVGQVELVRRLQRLIG